MKIDSFKKFTQAKNLGLEIRIFSSYNGKKGVTVLDVDDSSYENLKKSFHNEMVSMLGNNENLEHFDSIDAFKWEVIDRLDFFRGSGFYRKEYCILYKLDSEIKKACESLRYVDDDNAIFTVETYGKRI